tara:strand:- start:838 stop:1305 length:468 start_codon:yes stop_codon:yes gene_type:complete
MSESSKKNNSHSSESNSSYDSDEIEDEAEKINVSKEFEEKVIKYVKLDNLIRKKNAEIKELKEQRKPCEEFILKYLDSIGQNTIDITGGKLRRNKSETKTSINNDIIKKSLTEKIKDPMAVEEILKIMEENRPLKTSINLKRTNERAKKNTKKKQ